MNANIRARRPKGYKPFWESEEEPKEEVEGPSMYDRLVGNKTAGQTATESIEEMKKKDKFGKLRNQLR